ncbi:MAG: adenosylmethionine--8-amino-7-oxononanoate transaminase [Alistipes sp.]|nr:adenosylmethionine--8-amino-7-oxononanoate transaminase [Alistipes sp.]
METEEEILLKFDKTHIWHPYTSMTEPLPVYPVTGADGCFIELADGTRLIDGMSSWWCAVHGYNHPHLNRAAVGQIERFSHVMFGGLTHRPAVELARRLVDITPEGLDRVFYCDSGSVAVEVAVKMAIQYMQASGRTGRTRLATVRGGYHGDTWQAMLVCDPETGMHSFYRGALPVHYFSPRPAVAFGEEWDPSDLAAMEALLGENHERIAAVILEPVVQGAGGMWFYHPEYVRGVRELCDRYGVLMIADEIATGFMRTGTMFACDRVGVMPDIMCLGKAITGGYMSFAAVMATARVAEVIASNPPYVFMHGPTFMGNPLACAVACASLELISDPVLPARIKSIEQTLRERLAPAGTLQIVRDVRVLGAIGVLELDRPVDMARVQRRCVEEGVWIRPFGRLFYIMPPYIIDDDQLARLCGAMLKIAAEMDAGEY